jgi:hypothetical protein
LAETSAKEIDAKKRQQKKQMALAVFLKITSPKSYYFFYYNFFITKCQIITGSTAILGQRPSVGFRKENSSHQATKKITTERSENTENLFQPLFPSSAILQKSTRVFLKAC